MQNSALHSLLCKSHASHRINSLATIKIDAIDTKDKLKEKMGS